MSIRLLQKSACCVYSSLFPRSMTSIASNLTSVRERVAKAQKAADQVKPVVLVAVSKIKPLELLQEAYEAGQRHFGENYAKELAEKSLQMPKDVQWHFIGHIQSKQAKFVVQAGDSASLIVETVDREKIADTLNKLWAAKEREDKLPVFVQVNTSGEEAKHGVPPSECVSLVRYVLDNCPSLEFRGLMTIGKFDGDPKDDFKTLVDCRERTVRELSLEKDQMELSMGMSSDFETAIALGSTNVRVGTTIFGVRQKKIDRT